MALTIRPFVKGQDEDAWIDVFNRVVAEFPDTTPTTRAEYDMEVNSPHFGPEGRFVAGLDGTVIGTVHAELDPEDKQRIGYLGQPRVLPEHRRQGIGTALARRAFDSFREREIAKIQCGVRGDNPVGKAFLENLGFRQDRVMSWMRRGLDEIPAGPGDNPAVEIRLVPDSPDSLVLRQRLYREAFSEHFNFRVPTLESMRYWQEETAKLGITVFRQFAFMQGEPVGYLSSSIDPRECEHLNRRRGNLEVLGVLKPFRH
jgi:RimJ/RimL family protein N-acetyltransferase